MIAMHIYIANLGDAFPVEEGYPISMEYRVETR